MTKTTYTKSVPARATKGAVKGGSKALKAARLAIEEAEVVAAAARYAKAPRASSTAPRLKQFLGAALAMPVHTRVEIERQGVSSEWIRGFSTRLKRPKAYVFDVLGVPASTGKRLEATKGLVTGTAGHAAVALARLLAYAEDMAHEARADERPDFEVGAWLADWLDAPNPALGAMRPRDLIDTPSGALAVERTLGAVLSGSYQ